MKKTKKSIPPSGETQTVTETGKTKPNRAPKKKKITSRPRWFRKGTHKAIREKKKTPKKVI